MNTVRISKKSLAALPAAVAEAVKDVQTNHPNVKSFNFKPVAPSYKFYGGEGYEITVILGDARTSVEMVSESTVGAANVHYGIGGEFSAPVGTFVLVVSYYGKYWLDVYNVQPHRLSS